MESMLSVIARGFLKTLDERRAMVCAACGHQGQRRRPAQGGGPACAACGSHVLVSCDSPIGRGKRVKHSPRS